jgi:site-specific DNA recombinase
MTAAPIPLPTLAEIIPLYDPSVPVALPSTKLRVVVYARISEDKKGEALGVDRQVFDCRTLVTSQHWEVVGTYMDNDRPALNRGHRPEYDRMITHVEAGGVDAIVAINPDRLTRNNLDLEGLIQLSSILDRRGVAVYTVRAGRYELATPQGRLFARIAVSVAAHESEEKGERVRAEQRQRARRGLAPIHRRPYGYVDYTLSAPHPDEAPVVRAIFDALDRGVAMSRIARDLNAQGAPTLSRKAKWVHQSIRHIATAPRHAGYLKATDDETGQPILRRGQWEPLVPLDQWQRVNDALNDPGRVETYAAAHRERQPRLLTGLMFTVAGEPIRGRHKEHHAWVGDGEVRYYSGPGVQVRTADLEAIVMDRLYQWLARGGLADVSGSDEERAAQLRKVVDEAKAQLDRVRADRKAGLLDYEDFLDESADARDRRDAAKEELRQLAQADDQVTELLRTPAVLADLWDDDALLPLARRREVLARVIERIVVKPGGRGRNARLINHPERVDVQFKRQRR